MAYTLYLLSLIISAAVAVALAFYLWQRRSTPGATPAIWLMLAVVVWSLGYVLQFKSTELSGQIFATNIQYLGIVTVPVMWFVFSLEYTGHDKWLTRRNLFLLAIVPFVTVVLAWTNSFHGLMWYGRHLETTGPFTVIAKTYGLWFWVHTSYSYLLMLFGMLILLRRLFRPPRLYRGQSIALLICVVVPLVWNVLYIFQLAPIYRLDLTPSAFTISGLAMAFGLFRFRLLDVIPVARDAIIECMSDGVIVLDRQNRFVDLNLAAEHIVGYPTSEIIGQPVDCVLSGQPELVELLRDVTEARVEVVIKKGETQRYYESHISPLHDRRGRLTGRLIILRDITEHKLIEMRNKELEEKAYLANRLAAIGEMASGIAHEINNPLASVIGYADWLLERDIPKEIRGDLEIINRTARRVSEIVNRLLTFAGQYEAKRDYIDINRVIEAAIELRAHSLVNNNMEVVNQLDPNLPKTMADSGQLQEVFINLIVNAETSMKESHGGGKLLIKTETVDNNMLISFKDDGLGITRENLDKIFQPFFTTKDVGKGTGLGLSICHGIISTHGGRIYAESEFGKGITFFIELPVVIEDKQQKRTEPPPKRPDKPVEAKILVVDDEPEIRELLSMVLSKEGYEVETTGNAVDVLEKLKGKQFDLILLDIKIPGMSGIDLYRHLEETTPSTAKNIIFITGDVIGANTRDFLAKVEAPYITKPFNIRQLKEDIDHILRKGK